MNEVTSSNFNALIKVSSVPCSLQLDNLVRDYQCRRPGHRTYQACTQWQLNAALKAFKSHKMSQREAEIYYKINWSTLKNKMKGGHPLKPGRPRVLTDDEESIQHYHSLLLWVFKWIHLISDAQWRHIWITAAIQWNSMLTTCQVYVSFCISEVEKWTDSSIMVPCRPASSALLITGLGREWGKVRDL